MNIPEYAKNYVGAKMPEYLYEIPTEVPVGRIVVHNRVKPQPELGMNGFRAWLQTIDSSVPDYRHIVCGCGWAPELPEHYRIEVNS